ncbi:fimbria/pilus outer membrane usher protein [Vibrio sp. S4M6]|uniref:fimbria/pilus outer membrane usher protein n=1 Tax=Vibrio sinus TaxID=2946865 RepID=UPI00202A06AD|nr:fimbria/pilus outer membrane usher protein [Vibrio sinus]MCL9780124.1 fimbria/pilus outer membrane usher protein [Vibrio sinus]
MKHAKPNNLVVTLFLLCAITSSPAVFAISVPKICLNIKASPLLPSISINGSASQVWAACQKEQQLWLPKEAFTKANVVNFSGLDIQEEKHQPFVIIDKNSKGITWDPRSQALSLIFPSWRFKKDRQNLQQNTQSNSIQPSSTNGAFLNYNVSGSMVDRSQYYAAISGELGVFTHQQGFFSQAFVYTPNQLNNQTDDTETPDWLRLDTRWRKDDWYHLTTLVLGDSTTSSAHWGGSVNFGGISFYKNYQLRPKLDIRSLPQINQNATLPQDVQLKVNGVPVGNYQVNPGAYQFYNIPVTDGSGTITVTSTNRNGQVSTYSIPYFADTNLLKAGLSSYSYQFGWLRQHYGESNSDYGPAAAVLNYNYGVTPIWTYQLHASLLQEQQTLGSTQYLRTGSFGILSADITASMQHSQSGTLTGLGYNIRWGNLSLNSNAQYSSEHFTQISTASDESTLNNGLQTSVGVAYYLGAWGHIATNAMYIHNQYSDNPSSHIYTATYTLSLSSGLNLVGSYQAQYGEQKQYSFGINLSYQFDRHSSMSSSNEHTQYGNSQLASYMTNHELGGGKNLSTSLSMGRSDGQNQVSGSVYLGNTPSGDYSLNFYQEDANRQIIANADGALLWMDHHLMLSPSLYDGFALIETSKIGGVGIKQNGLSLGLSNDEGDYVIPNLTAYTSTNIGISPNLPLNMKAMDHQFDIMPSYRSGILVKFDIKRIHQILVRLVDQTQNPLALGTHIQVTIDGKEQKLLVGSHGLAYFSGEGHLFKGSVLDGAKKRSKFTIRFPQSNNTVIRTTAVLHPPLQLARKQQNINRT